MRSKAVSEVSRSGMVERVSPRRFLKGSPQHQAWLENRPEVRKPYLLSWKEQHTLLDALAKDLKPAVLFMLSTGCRERELSKLQWAWETRVSALQRSVFKIPVEGQSSDRLLFLNVDAQAILEEQRGLHPTHVFSYKGEPMTQINRWAWQQSIQKLGLLKLRVHDLRRTFEARLGIAGVGLKERQVLLGCQGMDDSDRPLYPWIELADTVCGRAEQGISG